MDINGPPQYSPGDIQVYDVGTDTWYEGGNIPSHRFRFVAAAHADSIYIFGGQGALIGSHNAAGSKYPVLDVVDRYKETITIGVTGLEPMSTLGGGGVMGISIDGAIWRPKSSGKAFSPTSC